MYVNRLKSAIIFLVGVVIFSLTLPRGLYFDKENLAYFFIIFSVLLFWVMYKLIDRKKINVNLLTLTILFLPVCFTIPFLTGQAANSYTTITFILRYSFYAALFLVILDLTYDDPKLLGVWLRILAFAGLISVIFGFDAIMGGNLNSFFGFSGGFDGINISGFIQYKNTFGAYIAFIFLLFVYLVLQSKTLWTKTFYTLALSPIILCLLFTNSRGAIVVLIILLALLFFLLPKYFKSQYFLILLSIGIPILIFSANLETYLVTTDTNLSTIPYLSKTNQPYTVQLLITLSYIIGSSLLNSVLFFSFFFIKERITTHVKFYNVLRYIVFSTLIVFGITICLLVFLQATNSNLRILPHGIIDRFKQMGTIEDITSQRNLLYADGLRLLKDHWLIGTGGGGYESLYREYRSWDFDASEVHSSIIQLWIEAGILGTLSCLFLVVGVSIYFFRVSRKSDPVLSSILYMAFISILLHSFIDFDFSFVSFAALLFIIAALILTFHNNTKEPKFFMSPWILLPITIFLVGFTSCILISRAYVAKANELVKVNISTGSLSSDIVQNAMQDLLTAAAFNPFDPSIFIRERKNDPELFYDLRSLSEIQNAILSDYFSKISHYVANDKIETEEARISQLLAQVHSQKLFFSLRALSMEAHNPSFNLAVGADYALLGDNLFTINQNNTQASLYLENGIKFDSLNIDRYEDAVNIYESIGTFYMKNKMADKAHQFYSYIINIEKKIGALNSTKGQHLTISSTLKDSFNKAKAY